MIIELKAEPGQLVFVIYKNTCIHQGICKRVTTNSYFDETNIIYSVLSSTKNVGMIDSEEDDLFLTYSEASTELNNRINS